MRQKLIIIHQDELGQRARVAFTQTDEAANTEMQVSGLQPDELIKLMMLVRDLATQTMQNVATMGNDSKK